MLINGMEYSIRVLMVLVVLLIMVMILAMMIFQWGGQINQNFSILTNFFNGIMGIGSTPAP